MPKYLLLKHYRGGPEPRHPFPPLDQLAPEFVEPLLQRLLPETSVAPQLHVRGPAGSRLRRQIEGEL